jgi:threonine aldolase
MKIIDLRSDTVTQPTDEMRLAMFQAEVGDDVFQDDPTLNKLEEIGAKMFGKDAAVFVPSGTFSNQLAIFTHTKHGDEVLVDQNAHIVIHESGASSIIAGVQLFTLESNKGIWDLEKLKRSIKTKSAFTAGTTLICIENAYNGKVLPLDYMKQVYEIAQSRNIPVHLDGARIFNAATHLNCDVRDISQYADSVSVCLSKGLAAPVGTLLIGKKAFIDIAREKRKLMGGGMRQAGFLGAAGIIALQKMSKRLHIDHDNAQYLASKIETIAGFKVDYAERDINIVFFDTEDERKYDLESFLLSKGVKILPYEHPFRFVTHHNIDKKDIDYVIELMREFFS